MIPGLFWIYVSLWMAIRGAQSKRFSEALLYILGGFIALVLGAAFIDTELRP